VCEGFGENTKMRNINWTIHTGYPTAKHQGSFEVDEDTTDNEIYEEIWNRLSDFISISWEEEEVEEEEEEEEEVEEEE
jgi:hypothetical protein